MKGASVFTLAALLLALAASLTAKGPTTKITVSRSSGWSTTITDPAILDAFDVWSGPGTFANGVEGKEGFIIDWSSGIVENRPSGLRRYEVSFYTAVPARAASAPVYMVSYEYDAASNRGYVYLPGKGDARYPGNTGQIIRRHGFEGHWFLATKAWRQAVAPALQ